MAHTIKNKDKLIHSNVVFSRLSPPNAEDVQPHSQFSQKLPHDPKHNPSKPFSNPFVNFQVTIVNDSMKKRKLDDTSCNTGVSGDFKKPRCLNALSPDLGCFMDFSSPLSGRVSASAFDSSQSQVNEHTQACSSEIEETLSSRLDLEHVKCGSSRDQAVEVEDVQLSARSEKHLINISRDFDYDVDDILCLKLDKKEGQKKAKEAKTDRRAVEEDKGYDSSFHPNENKEEHNAETPPKPQCQEQTSVYGQHSSFVTKECSASVNWPLLEPVKSAEEYLEGDDDVLIIGNPMFESSLCQPNATDEQRSQLIDVLKEPVSYSVDDTTVDTLYETTLPLQVQVKSKVVVPNVPENIKKQASPPPPPPPPPPPQKQNANSSNKKNRKKTVQRAESERHQRSKICDDEVEWERQKRQYVFSVRSHMTENQVTTQGYMTELRDLMTLVAGQTGSNGSKWQHPSDLTCRNYQWRFCNEMPWMTLSEWQAKNLINHKRFSKVPKIFERSPFP